MTRIFAVAALLLVLAVVLVGFVLPVYAQQVRQGAATTRISGGLIVEEVRVGTSCVVVVSSDGPGQRTIAAVPCSR